MDRQAFNQGLLNFISTAPTPFHAVSTMAAMLEPAGFTRLDEDAVWTLEPGKAYHVQRGGSVIAFRVGSQSCIEHGIHLAGAHTDSPCLKVKPVATSVSKGYVRLGVEVYGGVLQNPWFDRDLSIAGKVSYLTRQGNIATCLVDFRDPVAIIPSLAIHLDREVNTSRTINAQQHLPALLMRTADEEVFDFDAFLLVHLQTRCGVDNADKIMSHELLLYDTQPPALVGLRQEFIAGARLDNLLSCFLITQSLLECDARFTSIMVCNDHEEVGSASASGAQGPFLRSVLARLVASESTSSDALERVSRKSLFLSIDNAHGIHPNYADRHDPEHGPLLNSGPVIKINANQRYASNTESIARFRACCDLAGVQTQSFVMRSDLACGSTIGPLTATGTGINTVDIGVPTFAMHSIRELAGCEDAANLHRVVTAFFNRQSARPAGASNP